MESISFFWSFVKMLASLALVIALMVGAMVVFKKYFYQSPSVSAGSALINVLSTRPIGPKSSFMMIEVLDQILLVGVSPQGISLLTSITDSDALTKLKAIRQTKGPRISPNAYGRYKSLLNAIGGTKKDH